MIANYSKWALAALFVLALPAPSFSASEDIKVPEKCDKGFVLDPATNKCVKKTSQGIPDKAITDQAWL